MNNQFIFIGRICRNLILKDAGTSKVLDVTLAITRKFKNADGTYDTDFVKCKAFGKTAENISNWCKVGDLICINGRVQTGSYVDQEEKKIYTTDFIINSIQYLASSKKEESKQEESKQDVEEDLYSNFAAENTIELENLPFN